MQVDGEPVEDEEEEDDVSESDEDEEAAIEKAIMKKYPDYKQCLQILNDLKKQYPQTGINGE